MRPAKYTIEHIKQVHNYMNNENLSKKEAIYKAGFTSLKSYYNVIARLNLKEKIGIEKKISFI